MLSASEYYYWKNCVLIWSLSKELWLEPTYCLAQGTQSPAMGSFQRSWHLVLNSLWHLWAPWDQALLAEQERWQQFQRIGFSRIEQVFSSAKIGGSQLPATISPHIPSSSWSLRETYALCKALKSWSKKTCQGFYSHKNQRLIKSWLLSLLSQVKRRKKCISKGFSKHIWICHLG